MPHFTEFNSKPPFPNDVSVAKLECVSLANLRTGGRKESEALFRACKNDGFLFLDLCGDKQGETTLNEAGKLFDMGKTFYKGIGLSKVDSEGTPDRCEFYGISKDDLFDLSAQLPSPPLINSHRPLFKTVLSNNYDLELMILTHLENHLELPPGYDPHTDFGSVTSLFNILGGLQVLPIGAENKEEIWQDVQPQTGCAIINLGDSMVKWTNGLLKSAMHRVTYAPGKQANNTRWNLAYCGHAHNGSLVKRMDGGIIPPLEAGVTEDDLTAEDWLYVWSTSHKQKDMKDFERMAIKEEPAPIVE